MYGFFIAPVEVLPEISIPDTYFVHERGTYVGLYSLILNGGNFIGPFIAGFINDAVDWHWVEHWCALLLALNTVIAFFFQEESMFERGHVEPELTSVPLSGQESKEKEANGASVEASRSDPIIAELGHSVNPSLDVAEGYIRKGWWNKLEVYQRSGVSWRDCATLVYRPFLIFLFFPNVMWASFQYSVYNATASSILSSAPYGYSTTIVGTTYLAPLLGAIIGGIVAGPLSDKFSIILTRHNGGLGEAEHRLWGMALYTCIMPLGLFMWGIGAAMEAPIAVLLCGSVFCGFGIVAGGSYAITYNVDSYPAIVGESMVSLIMCRNTVTFIISYAITPWIQASGVQNTFVAVGVIAFVTGSLFLIMIWKGKAFRRHCQHRYWRYAATQVIVHE
ncbi:hypothetical protein N7451_012690 [Penicillium sp. IBT 35674x]|nr:hypothetical protein N7451_012690 [Penicillium sp. IBT 35674x]